MARDKSLDTASLIQLMVELTILRKFAFRVDELTHVIGSGETKILELIDMEA